jgi:hypothetical protein
MDTFWASAIITAELTGTIFCMVMAYLGGW